MLDLLLRPVSARPLRVVCFGAHCDDIEIGCSGTLAVLQRRKDVVIDWVVLSGTSLRRQEARAAMNLFVRLRSRGTLHIADFPDSRFPAVYGEIKTFFESFKNTCTPDLILCHERDDRHQDHRIVNEMVWTTFRNHLILEYEVPKWDGGLSQPNIFVPLSISQTSAKVDRLLTAYQSQSTRDWFTRETFLALLRLRGLECRSPSGYAEAFHGRKIRVAGG